MRRLLPRRTEFESAARHLVPAGTRPRTWAILLTTLAASTTAASWAAHRAPPPEPPAGKTTVPDAAAAISPRAIETSAVPLIQSDTAPTAITAALPVVTARRLQETVDRLRTRPTNAPAADVDRWIISLATTRREEMQQILDRAPYYEPLIQEALARYNEPADLRALAYIESGLKPTATSSRGAAGIWQLMPRTARDLGLEVSAYVDERRDPVRSTFAAVRYLADLHGEFRSWHLAAAAYNAGDGRLGGTLQRYLHTRGGEEAHYWIIRSALPRETQQYVPKLLAVAEIARDPTNYGFTPPPDASPLRFREQWVPGGTPLEAIAAQFGTDPRAVYDLNPQLIRRTTPPGRHWPVRLPPDAAGDPGYARKQAQAQTPAGSAAKPTDTHRRNRRA